MKNGARWTTTSSNSQKACSFLKMPQATLHQTPRQRAASREKPENGIKRKISE
jgi:hypothetical protein